MKTSVSLLMAIISTSVVATEAPKLYKSIGADFNAQVIVAPYEKNDYYLLQYKGFEHELDGQTLLYKKVLNTSNIEDGYHYLLAGSNKVNFRNNVNYSLKNGTHVPTVQVYLTNKPMTNMIYSGVADIAAPQKMLDQYQARQGITESKISAKKQIDDAQQQFSATCNTSVKINVDWSSFEDIDAKTTPGMVSNYLNSLSKLCTQDKDYLLEVQSIENIQVKTSEKNDVNKVSRNNKELVIYLGKYAPNVTENSYTALNDVL